MKKNCRRERSHIHFLARAPEHDVVVAGVRKEGEVSIYVDVGKAMSEGMKFMIASSKVIVTAGNADGELPLHYIVKLEDKASGAQIYPNPTPIALKTPSDGQFVSVNSLDAFKNKYT